jgi:hypothetical protein
MHSRIIKYCYSFCSNSLYIPLTCQCNSLTLPETRGPGFTLPAVVVASLCRVRDEQAQIEGRAPKWTQWCEWLDSQAELSKHRLPNRLDESDLDFGLDKYLREISKPTVTDLLDEIVSSDISKWDSIVIAGEGEPTLRLDALIKLVHQLHRIKSLKVIDIQNPVKEQKPSIRVVTNGLLGSKKTTELLDAVRYKVGDSEYRMIDLCSVALMTHDIEQYDDLMRPNYGSISLQGNKRAYHFVQDFIRSCLDAGVKVEATAVSRPDVDKEATEKAAAALGISLPVRWRTFFP